MLYGFFHPFCLSKKIIGKRVLDLSIEGRILTSTSHVFFFETICKKNIYNVNHCASIIKKNPNFFFLLGIIL
jgi:hypothetical protein